MAASTDCLLDRVYAELRSRNFEVRLNRRHTHLQFKYCTACGNPNWNLDIEVSEHFYFNCWACGYSGRSSTFLRRLGVHTRIPNPDGTLSKNVTKQTYVYHSYPTAAQKQRREIETFEDLPAPDLSETNSKLHLSGTLKRVFKSHPVTIGGLTSTDGYLLLGENGDGVMLYDIASNQNRKTRSDLFLYHPSHSSGKTLVVVEGFGDIFPFFVDSLTLVLGGSFLPRTLFEELTSRYSFSQVIVALDKKAEKPFQKQAKKYFQNCSLLILEPEKHSPAESQFLKLKQFDLNI